MTYWEIEGIGVEAVVDQSPHTVTPGSTVGLECLFGDYTRTAYGEFPYGERPYGGWMEAYDTLRRFIPYQSVETDIEDDGTPFFIERTPEQAPIETLLVSVNPVDVLNYDPYWGVITDVTDESVITGSDHDRRRLDFETFVLAPLEDYSDKSDVREAYHNEPI